MSKPIPKAVHMMKRCSRSLLSGSIVIVLYEVQSRN